MSKLIDLVGQKFGRLTVVARGRNKGSKVMWICACECGAGGVVQGANLKSGHTKYCCLGPAAHGHTRGQQKSGEYHSWAAMLERTRNPKQRSWKNYGARGITVCERWQGKHGFENFFADMGNRPERKTLDRIDNAGNYEPSNCRWATATEQRRNQRPRRCASEKLTFASFGQEGAT